LVEATHHGAAMALGPRGEVLFSIGDVERPLFYRSAIKPFQATIVLESGVELTDEEVAVAASSHVAEPVHMEIVHSMLARVGLDSSFLRCPPGPALVESSRLRLQDAKPDPVHHMCSGKHAAMLMACVERGWPVETYLDPDHPGQLAILDLVEEVTGERAGPPGIDGCGYPTLRGSVQGMASAFARLMFDDRFTRVRVAMTRFPALASGTRRSEVAIARAIDGVCKTGAAGLLGVGAPGRFGLAVRSFDGSDMAAAVAAAEICFRLGVVAVPERLDNLRHRPLMGGGAVAGQWKALP
ncbi:MAG: asparaginase, partial [Acidimicrobiia bacterium]|nr:asparaginase [Acidimicrobiia bacterium]